MQEHDRLLNYPITAPANTNVLVISVLFFIAGGLMIGVGICAITCALIIGFVLMSLQ